MLQADAKKGVKEINTRCQIIILNHVNWRARPGVIRIQKNRNRRQIVRQSLVRRQQIAGGQTQFYIDVVATAVIAKFFLDRQEAAAPSELVNRRIGAGRIDDPRSRCLSQEQRYCY